MKRLWSFIEMALIVLLERRFAKKFLKTTYHVDLTVQIYVSKRILKAGTLGMFVMENGTEPAYIAIDETLATFKRRAIFRTVLIHELVHYALFVQRLPYEDGTPLFQQEVVKHGSLPTGGIVYEDGEFSMLKSS
ncbi:hypothetical protein [Kurthia massiliensis]|uniref:hypothetical protein n=1 Tax=Kurthia massiliensis TaxID=1033739 RepID=UPI00028A2EF6|nr:hypothetical protein [Kurthia massiliensis]